ncbi:MAG: sigma-54 dependent transcriptional regulator [Bdellovibrionales bacterium]|nr:sigma-54 dependent transcriptional regulator [Bdellovibrionales bacterium]
MPNSRFTSVKSADIKAPIAILIVDDDEVTRNLLQEVLGKIQLPAPLEIFTAESGEEAVQRIAEKTFPIILSDVRMLELDGMAVLQAARKKSSATSVILMTGFGSMEGAIAAIREGAFDYVSKPFKLEQIEAVVQRAARHWESLATQAMRRASKHFSSKQQQTVSAREIVGKSARIVEVYKVVARAALSPSAVLLMGEVGTGKSMVARAIHQNSQRRAEKFIPWSATDLSTPADFHDRVIEAKKGTLYIEEVSELSLAVQLELLRLLEDEQASVRVIAATHADLSQLAQQGSFREDLLYQLKVITIELPPLRERLEDLPELIEAFLVRYSEKNEKNISHVADETLEVFRKHSWPGNVRELEHAIERAVVLANSSVLFPEDFPGLLESSNRVGTERGAQAIVHPMSAETSLEEVEKQHILRVLQEVNYNKSKASEILGIDRVTLYRKASRYGIDLRLK